MSVTSMQQDIHDDLAYGDTVTVEVADHDGTRVEMTRVDGKGSFFLDLNCGLGFYDQSFGKRLRPGARFEATVIPGWSSDEPVTVSILPDLLHHLAAAPGTVRLSHRGTQRTFLPATVIGEAIASDYMTIELDHRDEERGVSHRFAFRAKSAREGVPTTTGSPLLIALHPEQHQRRGKLEPTDQVLELVERHADYLELHALKRRVHPAVAPLPSAVIDDLLQLDSASEWQHTVWRFYADGLRMSVDDVRASVMRIEMELAPEVIGLAAQRRAQISARHGVRINLDAHNGTVHLTGDDAASVAATKAEFDRLNALPVIVITIAKGTAERILNDGADVLRRLRDDDYIVAIDVTKTTVTVVARTRAAAMSAARTLHELTLPCRGHVQVPEGKSEHLIGTGGATIELLSSTSGCRPRQVGEDTWTIEGPNPQSVDRFIELAKGVVYGTTGGIEIAGVMHRVVDRPSPQVAATPLLGAATNGAAKSLTDRLLESVSERAASQPTEATHPDSGSRDAPTSEPTPVAEPTADAGGQSAPGSRTGDHHRATPRRARPRRAGAAAQQQAPRRGHRRALRISAALASVAAVVVAAVLVMPGGGDAEISGPIGAPSPLTTAATTAPAQQSLSFVLPASEPAAETCWLGVLGPWSQLADAGDGIARLSSVGLAATILDSARVAAQSPGEYVAVVATANESGAQSAVERARDAGFDGEVVEGDAAACQSVDVVPEGAPVWLADVTADAPSYPAIRWAIDAGIMVSCGNGIDGFCPNATVSRDDLALVLAETFGPEGDGTHTFRDIADPATAKAADAVVAASLMTPCGDDDGQFCPDAAASRGEGAQALARALALDEAAQPFFVDTAESAHRKAADALHAAGIVGTCSDASEPAFCPDGAIVRETLAVWLYHAYEYATG